MIITIKATAWDDKREFKADLDYDDMDISFVLEELVVLLTRYGYKTEDIQDAIVDRADEIVDTRSKE